MKKRILSVFLILLSVVVLASCKKDKDKPVFGGVEDKTIELGKEFNPMEGVTATDKLDGDLTEKIKVEGEVDVNVEAVYIVTYRVTNSKGVEAIAKRNIEVYRVPLSPTFSGIEKHVLVVGQAFDPKEGVTAKDEDGVDLTAQITVTSNVNVSKVGRYDVTYKVTAANGLTGYGYARVLVLESLEGLYDGSLNLKFAPAEVKNTFFAAAERYLLDNVYGGIPYYVANSYSLRSERVELVTQNFIPTYGWGFQDANITMDDSKVKNSDGEFGQVGKYTNRTWDTQTFSTLNYWIYDDSVSNTYLSPLNGAFYRAVLNDAKNGWLFAPDLAETEALAYGDSIKEIGGKTVSNTWRIKLREDLQWSFGPNVANAGQLDTSLTGEDFYWTYREALTKSLYRAISGGGDFVKEIVGAADYNKIASEIYTTPDKVATPAEQAKLDAAWAKVGIKLIDDYTLEFTSINAKSQFEVHYGYTWPAMHRGLYERDPKAYGKDDKTIASSGEYVMVSHENNKLTKYEKNANYPHKNDSKWTGLSIAIYSDVNVAFQAFLDGKLETAGVPNERTKDFISDPRLLQTPDATTWRLNINMLGTREKQQAQFPGSNFTPEPLLSYKNARKALFHIIDRKELQKDWVQTSGIGTTYFSDAYYVDPESGIPYRASEQGQAVFDEFSGDTWGYNHDGAIAYFKQAVSEAIKDGHYVKGTANKYTEIKLDVRFMNLTTSEATKLRADFVKKEFEKLVDDVNFVKVVVDIVDTPFPGIYYDYQMVGNFDIAIGGISGSTLDASSFLDVFASDNRGGFTLNWGFDSGLPEIPVTWENEGVQKTAIFSYDAIVSALNGKVTIENGMEVPPILIAGEHDTWESVLNTLEDFFDRYSLPDEFELENGKFTVVDGKDKIGGVWVMLPTGFTFEQLQTVLTAGGMQFSEEAADEWPAEFAKGSVYAIWGEHLNTETGKAIAKQYGINVPTGPGFYIYS